MLGMLHETFFIDLNIGCKVFGQKHFNNADKSE